MHCKLAQSSNAQTRVDRGAPARFLRSFRVFPLNYRTFLDKERNGQAWLQLCSEEHGPKDLVVFAQRAEETGFSYAMISDHYHP